MCIHFYCYYPLLFQWTFPNYLRYQDNIAPSLLGTIKEWIEANKEQIENKYHYNILINFSKNCQEFTKILRKLDKFYKQLVALILVSPDVETFSYFILTTDIKIIVAFEFIRHKAHKRKLSKGISQKSVRM